MTVKDSIIHVLSHHKSFHAHHIPDAAGVMLPCAWAQPDDVLADDNTRVAVAHGIQLGQEALFQVLHGGDGPLGKGPA